MPLLSPEVAGYIVVGLLLLWLALGVHIGVALGLAGFIGIYLTVGPDAALAQIADDPVQHHQLLRAGGDPAVHPDGLLRHGGRHRRRTSSARRTSGSATCGAGSRWRP